MNKPTSSIRTTAGMSVDKKARSLKLRPKTKSYARRRARATGVLKILLKIGLPNIIFYWSTDQNDYFRCFAYILVSINIVAHNDSI